MYLRTINRQTAEVSCDHCGTTFTVTRDEDGGADIEHWPCQDDEHTHKLCDECRCKCFSCDLSFCREALTDFGGELYCRVCLDGMVQEVEVHAA